MEPFPPKQKKYLGPDVLRTNRSWISATDAIAFMPFSNGGYGNKQFTLYVKVHPTVLLHACDHCGAPKGQLCRGRGGTVVTGTHSARRYTYNHSKRHKQYKERIARLDQSKNRTAGSPRASRRFRRP